MPNADTSYFELFDLPQDFDIDQDRLAAVYRKLQATHHPDRFASADAATRRASLETAALINEAYQTLIDPLKRGFYLLRLAGVEAGPEHHTIKDGEFLLKQMAYQERLDGLVDRDDPLAAVDDLRDQLEQEKQQLVEQFKAAYVEKDFDQALDHLTKLQFFGRLQSRLGDIEARLEEQLLD